MTQDFRQPGPRRIGSDFNGRQAAARGQGAVSGALLFGALIFFLLGIGLLSGKIDFFQRGTADILGATLIMVAFIDVLIARWLKWLWGRRNGQAAD